MLIFKGDGNYQFDPVRNLNFKDYITTKNVRLSWGINSLECDYEKDYINIAVYFEEPNFLIFHSIDCMSKCYDIKLTLCKYTANKFNKMYKNKKCYNVFFPIDTVFIKNELWNKYNYDLEKKPTWKNINVLYTGGGHDSLIDNFFNIMKKYNNNKNVHIPTYLCKMDAYLHSKIAIVHNLLFFKDTPEKVWEQIPEFSGKKILPQLKSRVFEAACSQCIILCYKDDYNTIEDYFIPGEEFLYFKDNNELENIIEKILENYDNYVHIAKNAYNKFMDNYTLKHFCDKYINIY